MSRNRYRGRTSACHRVQPHRAIAGGHFHSIVFCLAISYRKRSHNPLWNCKRRGKVHIEHRRTVVYSGCAGNGRFCSIGISDHCSSTGNGKVYCRSGAPLSQSGSSGSTISSYLCRARNNNTARTFVLVVSPDARRTGSTICCYICAALNRNIAGSAANARAPITAISGHLCVAGNGNFTTRLSLGTANGRTLFDVFRNRHPAIRVCSAAESSDSTSCDVNCSAGAVIATTDACAVAISSSVNRAAFDIDGPSIVCCVAVIGAADSGIAVTADTVLRIASTASHSCIPTSSRFGSPHSQSTLRTVFFDCQGCSFIDQNSRPLGISEYSIFPLQNQRHRDILRNFDWASYTLI